jgi:hypothetical protein
MKLAQRSLLSPFIDIREGDFLIGSIFVFKELGASDKKEGINSQVYDMALAS